MALQGRRLLASCQVLHLVTRKGSKKVRPRPCVLHLFSDIIILCEEVKGRHMLRLVLPVDGTNAEQVNEDAIPALKGLDPLPLTPSVSLLLRHSPPSSGAKSFSPTVFSHGRSLSLSGRS